MSEGLLLWGNRAMTIGYQVPGWALSGGQWGRVSGRVGKGLPGNHAKELCWA